MCTWYLSKVEGHSDAVLTHNLERRQSPCVAEMHYLLQASLVRHSNTYLAVWTPWEQTGHSVQPGGHSEKVPMPRGSRQLVEFVQDPLILVAVGPRSALRDLLISLWQ